MPGLLLRIGGVEQRSRGRRRGSTRRSRFLWPPPGPSGAGGTARRTCDRGRPCGPSGLVLFGGADREAAIRVRGFPHEEPGFVVGGVGEPLDPGPLRIREVQQPHGPRAVGDGQPEAVVRLQESGPFETLQPARGGARGEPGEPRGRDGPLGREGDARRRGRGGQRGDADRRDLATEAGGDELVRDDVGGHGEERGEQRDRYDADQEVGERQAQAQPPDDQAKEKRRDPPRQDERRAQRDRVGGERKATVVALSAPQNPGEHFGDDEGVEPDPGRFSRAHARAILSGAFPHRIESVGT